MASEICKMVMGMGSAFALGTVFLAATVAEGVTIYENDFSTRRSVGAIPFRRSNTDLGGISCLGIHQLGAKGSILKEDQNILLIDNIRIDHSPAGCIVVFR